jgi:hypothetical protein
LRRFCFDLQKSEGYSLAAAPCFSANPGLAQHIHARLDESIRERVPLAGLGAIRPTVPSEVAGERPLQTIVTIELQLGVREQAPRLDHRRDRHD